MNRRTLNADPVEWRDDWPFIVILAGLLCFLAGALHPIVALIGAVAILFTAIIVPFCA